MQAPPSDTFGLRNQSVPGNFTFVDLQAPLGHVAHALLALLAAVHGQVVDVRSFVGHFEVPDAAVSLQGGGTSQSVRLFEGVCVGQNDGFGSESNLATEVDDPSVGVKKGQEDAAAGVQLLQRQRL